MKYVDIHSHLGSAEYDADRPEVIAHMEGNEVGTITIGTDLSSSKKAVEIAEQNENVWACIGVHPHNRGAISELESLATHPKVVAIGECGLDYFRLNDEQQKILQKELFEQQTEFAIKYDKPLMLHVRDAYDDALDILRAYKKEAGEKLRGNVHFFAGDTLIAKNFLDLDFTLSFTGVITFTHDYDEVVKYLPQDSMMSETDAPWVAPTPYRGQRNEPVYVIEVVKKLAEIREEDPTVLSNSMLKNAERVFGFLARGQLLC